MTDFYKLGYQAAIDGKPRECPKNGPVVADIEDKIAFVTGYDIATWSNLNPSMTPYCYKRDKINR